MKDLDGILSHADLKENYSRQKSMKIMDAVNKKFKKFATYALGIALAGYLSAPVYHKFIDEPKQQKLELKIAVDDMEKHNIILDSESEMLKTQLLQNGLSTKLYVDNAALKKKSIIYGEPGHGINVSFEGKMDEAVRGKTNFPGEYLVHVDGGDETKIYTGKFEVQNKPNLSLKEHLKVMLPEKEGVYSLRLSKNIKSEEYSPPLWVKLSNETYPLVVGNPKDKLFIKPQGEIVRFDKGNKHFNKYTFSVRNIGQNTSNKVNAELILPDEEHKKNGSGQIKLYESLMPIAPGKIGSISFTKEVGYANYVVEPTKLVIGENGGISFSEFYGQDHNVSGIDEKINSYYYSEQNYFGLVESCRYSNFEHRLEIPSDLQSMSIGNDRSATVIMSFSKKNGEAFRKNNPCGVK